MKIKFIEEPREENLAAKNSFTSLLKGEMNSITGGDTCTIYRKCESGSGKSSCLEGFTCTPGMRTECTKERYWAYEPIILINP
ncbi:MAG: hypothetical protein LBC89_00245 [Bacteroidales bacterium]|nr:hypothetical protein [Bacteroidales bacterium]